MGRFQFSIASLLAAVAFVAVATRALRSATDAWDSGVFSIVLLTLLAATLLTVHFAGRRRAYWLGFSLFGWMYLAASLIPQFESRLATTQGLAFLRPGDGTFGVYATLVADADNDGLTDLFIVNGTPGATHPASGKGSVAATTKFMITANLNNVQNAGNGWAQRLSRWWSKAAAPGGSTENFVRIGHSIFALVLAFAGGHLSSFLRRRALRVATS